MSEQLFLEAFNSEPYFFEKEEKYGAMDIIYTFEDEAGHGFKFHFEKKVALGKHAYVCVLSQKTPGLKTYKRVIGKFSNPMRTVATLLAVVRDIHDTRKDVHGIVMSIPEQAFGSYSRLVKKIMTRELRTVLNVEDGEYTPEDFEKMGLVGIVTTVKPRNMNTVYTGPALKEYQERQAGKDGAGISTPAAAVPDAKVSNVILSAKASINKTGAKIVFEAGSLVQGFDNSDLKAAAQNIASKYQSVTPFVETSGVGFTSKNILDALKAANELSLVAKGNGYQIKVTAESALSTIGFKLSELNVKFSLTGLDASNAKLSYTENGESVKLLALSLGWSAIGGNGSYSLMSYNGNVEQLRSSLKEYGTELNKPDGPVNLPKQTSVAQTMPSQTKEITTIVFEVTRYSKDESTAFNASVFARNTTEGGVVLQQMRDEIKKIAGKNGQLPAMLPKLTYIEKGVLKARFDSDFLSEVVEMLKKFENSTIKLSGIEKLEDLIPKQPAVDLVAQTMPVQGAKPIGDINSLDFSYSGATRTISVQHGGDNDELYSFNGTDKQLFLHITNAVKIFDKNAKLDQVTSTAHMLNFTTTSFVMGSTLNKMADLFRDYVPNVTVSKDVDPVADMMPVQGVKSSAEINYLDFSYSPAQRTIYVRHGGNNDEVYSFEGIERQLSLQILKGIKIFLKDVTLKPNSTEGVLAFKTNTFVPDSTLNLIADVFRTSVANVKVSKVDDNGKEDNSSKGNAESTEALIDQEIESKKSWAEDILRESLSHNTSGQTVAKIEYVGTSRPTKNHVLYIFKLLVQPKYGTPVAQKAFVKGTIGFDVVTGYSGTGQNRQPTIKPVSITLDRSVTSWVGYDYDPKVADQYEKDMTFDVRSDAGASNVSVPPTAPKSKNIVKPLIAAIESVSKDGKEKKVTEFDLRVGETWAYDGHRGEMNNLLFISGPESTSLDSKIRSLGGAVLLRGVTNIGDLTIEFEDVAKKRKSKLTFTCGGLVQGSFESLKGSFSPATKSKVDKLISKAFTNSPQAIANEFADFIGNPGLRYKIVKDARKPAILISKNPAGFKEALANAELLLESQLDEGIKEDLTGKAPNRVTKKALTEAMRGFNSAQFTYGGAILNCVIKECAVEIFPSQGNVTNFAKMLGARLGQELRIDDEGFLSFDLDNI